MSKHILIHLLGARSVAMAMAIVVLANAPAIAQLDRLYPTDGSPVTGKVSEMGRDGVSIRIGTANQDYRVDQIQKLTFEGDPPGLTRGRDLAIAGQFDSALEQLKQINLKDIDREYIAADAIFFRILTDARLAMAGQGDKATAIKNLQRFASQYDDNYHFYQVAELLGDLAIASGDVEGSGRYYAALVNSEVPLVATRGKYLLATALLRQGKGEEAITGFDAVLEAPSLESAEGARLKTLARAGKAVAMARTGSAPQALEVTNELITTLNPEDHELASKIYNARGAVHEALGDEEGALLDYLHTHLLFSGVIDAHAEALSRMVVLWPKVGKPEKATEARQELQTRYPGWGG